MKSTPLIRQYGTLPNKRGGFHIRLAYRFLFRHPLTSVPSEFVLCPNLAQFHKPFRNRTG